MTTSKQKQSKAPKQTNGMKKVKTTKASAAIRSHKAKKGEVFTAIRWPKAELLQHTYTSKELAVRYGFPVISVRSKFWIGIVELGGGWSPKDLAAYCAQLRINVPNTASINLPGSKSKYNGNPNSADGEYALDMQVIAGATDGLIGLYLAAVESAIAIYGATAGQRSQWKVNAPNGGDGTGIAQGLQAVADWTPPGGGKVSAVSLSWGSDETSWDKNSVEATEAALQVLAKKNIPVFAASGDDGARDGGEGNNVDYPASSPNAFGCGGTSIAADGKLETAWSYGGGGLSGIFKTPTWQVANDIANISKGRRCVPDAAMNADPNSGYNIIVGGKGLPVGGTSAVAPMWAAWKALTDTVAGAVLPFSAASVYQLHDLTDIVVGYNGAFHATPGYDLCTGEGVPNVNFTQAWLAKNGATDSFAKGIKMKRTK